MASIQDVQLLRTMLQEERALENEQRRVNTQNQKAGKGSATGGSLGSILGSILGSFIAPGVGTALGGFLGGRAGSEIGEQSTGGYTQGNFQDGLFFRNRREDLTDAYGELLGDRNRSQTLDAIRQGLTAAFFEGQIPGSAFENLKAQLPTGPNAYRQAAPDLIDLNMTFDDALENL